MKRCNFPAKGNKSPKKNRGLNVMFVHSTDVLQTTPYCYGKGFTYFLSYVLFQDEEPFNILEVRYKYTVY